jgi:hypothetical protein
VSSSAPSTLLAPPLSTLFPTLFGFKRFGGLLSAHCVGVQVEEVGHCNHVLETCRKAVESGEECSPVNVHALEFGKDVDQEAFRPLYLERDNILVDFGSGCHSGETSSKAG